MHHAASASSIVVAAISPTTPAATPASRRWSRAILDHALEPVEEQQGEGERRQENPRGDRQRARQPARLIADEGREDDQRRRDDARQRQPVEELRVAQPAAPDRIVADERDRGVGAAKGQQARLEPGEEQQRRSGRAFALRRASRRCSGRAVSTATSAAATSTAAGGGEPAAPRRRNKPAPPRPGRSRSSPPAASRRRADRDRPQPAIARGHARRCGEPRGRSARSRRSGCPGTARPAVAALRSSWP